nr:hypothetical protein [Tanacetum cinerariifolium]
MLRLIVPPLGKMIIQLFPTLEPKSDKESPEVEITIATQPVNVNEEEKESVEDDYELRRREKGKHVDESRRLDQGKRKESNGFSKMIADAIQQERDNLRSEISSQINEAITNYIPSPSAVRLRDKDDPHDDAYPEGENDAKRQKTFEHGTFVFGELSSSQDYKIKQDLLYLKKGSLGLEKIVMSLHKFPAVLDLEEAKTAQAKEIASLKKRVKKLKKRRKSRTTELKRLKKVGAASWIESSEDIKASLGDLEDTSKQGRMIDNIDQYVEIALVNEAQQRMNDQYMFGVIDLDGDEVIVHDTDSEKEEQVAKVDEMEVSTAEPVTTAGEVITTANVEVSAALTTATNDDDELTLAKTLIEIKVAKPKAKSKAITIAMMDVDFKLAAKLQEEERGELSIEEKSKLFVELTNKRRKHFEMLRAKERRRRPPTKAQKKNDWINNSIAMDSGVVKDKEKGSSKRTTEQLKSNKPKKQKLDENVEAKVDDSAELKNCLEIVLEDEDDVTVNATPLYLKSLTIIDYKIHKEGKKNYFKIIRADGWMEYLDLCDSFMIKSLKFPKRGLGHKAKDYQSKNMASGTTGQSNVVCYECGERGHKSRACSKKADRQGICTHEFFTLGSSGVVRKEERWIFSHVH